MEMLAARASGSGRQNLYLQARRRVGSNDERGIRPPQARLGRIGMKQEFNGPLMTLDGGEGDLGGALLSSALL